MISNTNFFSIILPTFNHSFYLEYAIKSVLSQTYPNWELIVVNNFSSDNTIDVVNKFIDARIRLVNFANNGIIASSRNYGISLSQYDILAFIDSDDTWYQDKLERMDFLLADCVDLICHSEHWLLSGNVQRTVHYGPFHVSDFKSLLFRGNCFSTSSVVVRKSVVLSVGCFSEDQSFVTAEDYDLWLKISLYTRNILFFNIPLGTYLVHPGSASSSIDKHLSAILSVFRHHSASLLSNPFILLLSLRRNAHIRYSCACSCRVNNLYSKSFLLYFSSLLHYPFQIRSFYGLMLTAISFLFSAFNTSNKLLVD